MKKVLKIIGIIILIIAAVWLAIFLWPVEGREKKPFFTQETRDMLAIAHRGGANIAPEETLTAFQKSANLGVDVLEFDVHMTSDNVPVVIHDATVDRTTNGEGNVNEMTLNEIKQLDAGYHFQNRNGEYSYRGENVEIPTVEEVFQELPDQQFLIELKDTNDPDLYEPMIQEMWDLIQEYNMEDQVIIASFDHNINERFQEVSNNQVAIGAGEQEVTPYVALNILRLNSLANVNADALQLPKEQFGIDLVDSNLLEKSEERNIDVYYWTINNPETMRELIDKEVDGIMTDNPDILVDLLEENQTSE